MASPQAEEGYTKIANELLEAFSRLDASGSAWRVFMVVLRKTYGYHKKIDKVSLTQFEAMSGLTRKSVCRGINELTELRVITVEKDGYINTYQVQKDYSLWDSVKPVTSDKNDTKSSVKLDTKSSVRNDTYKRKKDNKDISDKSQKNMPWKKYNENDHSDDVPSIDADSGEKVEEVTKPKRHYKEVYEIFRVLGPVPLNWTVNTTEQKCADNLFTERGLEQIKNALLFYKEHKDEEYIPEINSPFDLDSKWKKLHSFKKRNG